MADSAHSLSTCRIPLSALVRYYRRNLEVGTDSPPVARSPRVSERTSERRVVLESPVGWHHRAAAIVTIAEFAAHTAYLEPLTGTGLLVSPLPGTDVVAPDDWFLEVAWAGQQEFYGCTGGLSLQTADRAYALAQLETAGWRLLDDGNGMIEGAGRTTDGRLAVCLYAGPATADQVVLEELQCAITALHAAADLRHDL